MWGFRGRFGLHPMKARVWSAGLVGGNETQVGEAELARECTGAVCILRPAPEGVTKSSSCCHYLHLGFVGIAGNLHYAELWDFLTGLFFL